MRFLLILTFYINVSYICIYILYSFRCFSQEEVKTTSLKLDGRTIYYHKNKREKGE